MSNIIGGIAGLFSLGVFLACLVALIALSVAFPFLGIILLTQGFGFWWKHREAVEPAMPAIPKDTRPSALDD